MDDDIFKILKNGQRKEKGVDDSTPYPTKQEAQECRKICIERRVLVPEIERMGIQKITDSGPFPPNVNRHKIIYELSNFSIYILTKM